MHGTVAIQHGGSVEVTAVQGQLVSFTLRGVAATPLKLMTPWQDARIQVWQDNTMQQVITSHEGRFTFQPDGGHVYRFAVSKDLPLPRFDAPANATVKSLGRASIGLGPPCCAPPAGYVPASDND